MMAFARRSDPDRFLGSLFAPPAARQALWLLIAFNHELARARDAATNPFATLIRLQWWRDAVAEATAGQPPRRHEVAAPLHAAIRDGTVPAEALAALIDAREIEAEAEGIPTRGAFDAYLRATAGGLAVAMGQVLGAAPADLAVLERYGALYGLAGVLRSVGAHAAQGRCLLPADALGQEGLLSEAIVADPRCALPVVRAMARAGLAAAPAGRISGPGLAAALPAVLARRDLALLAAGRAVPAPRGGLDRLAVILSGLRGSVAVA